MNKGEVKIIIIINNNYINKLINKINDNSE